MKKTNNNKPWLFFGLLAVLLAAPNATFIKVAGDVNPFLFNALRFGVVAIITSPLLLIHLSRFSKQNAKNAIIGSVFLATASITFVLAVQYSQASYVPLIGLLTPINFMLLSAKMTGERIKKQAVLGVLIAAIGMLLVVVLPIALHQQGDLRLYPLATALALLDTICFPLALIYFKKANEDGVPMSALMNLASWLVVVIGMLLFKITSSGDVQLSAVAIATAVYSGVAVLLIARSLNVVTYEHIGSAVVGALDYLEKLLAILIPVVILHETLSVEMVLGGALILCGVYMAEHHKVNTHKQHHFMKVARWTSR